MLATTAAATSTSDSRSKYTYCTYLVLVHEFTRQDPRRLGDDLVGPAAVAHTLFTLLEGGARGETGREDGEREKEDTKARRVNRCTTTAWLRSKDHERKKKKKRKL